MAASTEFMDKVVLDYLKQSEHPVDTKIVQELTSLHYQTVVRMMRRLLREKRVKRVPGPRNSYKYVYLTHEKTLPKHLKVKDTPVGTAISASSLEKQLMQWASLGWNNVPVVHAGKDMRKVVAMLYKQCALSLQGERELTRKDLDQLNDQLIKVRTMFQMHIDFVDGLLTTRELWSLDTVSDYLMSDLISDENDLVKLIRQADFVLEC